MTVNDNTPKFLDLAGLKILWKKIQKADEAAIGKLNLKYVKADAGKNQTAEIQLLNNGVSLGTIDATDFIKDGMLDNVQPVVTDNGETVLRFIFNTDTPDGTQKNPIDVNLKDLATIYTAGNGIEFTGEGNNKDTIDVKIGAVIGETNYLNVDKSGLKVTGMGAQHTTTSKKIVIAGGPLADELDTKNWKPDAPESHPECVNYDSTTGNWEIKANQSMEDILTGLFSKTLWPENVKFTEATVSVTAPSLTPMKPAAEYLEVGSKYTLNNIQIANQLTASSTPRKLENLTYGYSLDKKSINTGTIYTVASSNATVKSGTGVAYRVNLNTKTGGFKNVSASPAIGPNYDGPKIPGGEIIIEAGDNTLSYTFSGAGAEAMANTIGTVYYASNLKAFNDNKKYNKMLDKPIECDGKDTTETITIKGAYRIYSNCTEVDKNIKGVDTAKGEENKIETLFDGEKTLYFEQPNGDNNPWYFCIHEAYTGTPEQIITEVMSYNPFDATDEGYNIRVPVKPDTSSDSNHSGYKKYFINSKTFGANTIRVKFNLKLNK